ncbi:hypothetical protein FO440_18300 [Mucilaginibacter corticis]|uniref:Uncharacterized protein n=1 Tax=Mucilaginibacter corticis TaxID=2597670 RepID=A0A556MIE4_9SPHI|nr:hypothetical protein [Mucilaginibacter corticis]TSJ39691.1 hypothetical protein FO440_18300 [Mucilaginibacter corticis]
MIKYLFKAAPLIAALLLLLGVNNFSVAQIAAKNPVKLTHGQLVEPQNEALARNKIDPADYTGAIPITDMDFCIDLQKKLYAKLLDAANGTLDSLSDSRTGLKQFYLAFWGQNQYQTKLNELNDLIADLEKLKSNPKTIPASPLAKKIACTAKKLCESSNYQAVAKLNERQSYLQVDVYQDEAVRKFVERFFCDDCDASLQNLRKSDDYFTQLNELRQLFLNPPQLDAAFEFRCAGDANPFNQYLNEIDNNPLYHWFVQNKCSDALFWISGGSFRLTAFSESVKYDWPKLILFDKILDQKIDSIKRCCEDDPEKIQTLINALKSGKVRYKHSGGYLLGFKDRKDMLTDVSFVNHILIPIIQDQNCCGTGYVEPYKRKFIINYDASNDYRTSNSCLRPSVSEDEQIVIAVNNIPAEKNVIISGTDITIDNKSKAQIAISDIGTQLGSAYTAISGLPALGTVLNTNPVVVPPNPNITLSANYTNVPLHANVHMPNYAGQTRKILIGFNIKIGKHTLKFPGANKRDILEAYIATVAGADRPIFLQGLTFFLAKCNSQSISIKNQSDLLKIQESQAKQEVDDLISQFKKFMDENAERKAAPAVINNMKIVLAYLIPNLDNVQIKDAEINDKSETPQYSTVLSTFDFITGPKEKDYVLTEEAPKPGKSGAGAKPSGDASDSVKVNKLKGSFSVAKKHIVQVSGGIGITTNDYVMNDAAIVNNQLVVTPKDQQVSFIIGLHFFPAGAFNLDNSFLGIKNKKNLEGHFWNRFSIYTGVGIPDPSRNFYGGLSLDLVPGIRLTGGEHFIRYTKYQITNNVITDQAGAFRGAGPFFGLAVDADFVGKLFTLFK